MMTAEQMHYHLTVGELAGSDTATAIGGVSVRGLSVDSRTVEAGDLFFALSTDVTASRGHVLQACQRGASAVFSALPVTGIDAIPIEQRDDVRQLLGRIAHRFFGRVSERITVIGVTGTNGKTSVSHYIAHAVNTLRPGTNCSVIGTLGVGQPGSLTPGLLTTPDVLSVHRTLADLARSGAACVTMEVSSHALDQERVAGVHFDTAVFTNLSRDHLDYHGTMRAYGDAKRALFLTPGLRVACLNADDDFGRELIAELAGELSIFSYSVSGVPVPRSLSITPVSGRIVAAHPYSLTLDVSTPSDEAVFSAPVLGRFNAANLLASVCVLLARGFSLTEASRAMSTLPPVAGRMQSFGGVAGQPLVIVDYSHTPASLQTALSALREHTRGEIWCVFGCGGDRDAGKRPQMGAAASAGAEHVVITDDNPRSESGDRIIDDIRRGITDHSDTRVIRERSQAIRYALVHANETDVVLIAGKGHEDYQEIEGVRRPFSDADAVRLVLEERHG